MNNTVAASVYAQMHFLPSSQTGGPVRRVDLRTPAEGPSSVEATEVAVMNAHEHAGLGLHASGFELVRSQSAVTDFYDCDLVMATYYDECKAIAQKLTGAHTTFTYDHIIREPGLQLSGGGTDRSQRKTGVEHGGGYIGSVHMDYTDNTTWDRYLALHGERVPEGASRVYALNFWRPLSPSVDDHPLAVWTAHAHPASCQCTRQLAQIRLPPIPPVVRRGCCVIVDRRIRCCFVWVCHWVSFRKMGTGSAAFG